MFHFTISLPYFCMSHKQQNYSHFSASKSKRRWEHMSAPTPGSGIKKLDEMENFLWQLGNTSEHFGQETETIDFLMQYLQE